MTYWGGAMMECKKFFLLPVIFALLIFHCVTWSKVVQAQEILAVPLIISQLKSLITSAEVAASNLIQQGNVAAANQQMLLAGMLTGTLRQIEDAYGRQLDKTLDAYSKAQRDTFNNFNGVLRNISQLEAKSVQDLEAIIRQVQGASNQVLAQIPFVARHPVIYGVRTRDILVAFDESPKDIEVLGYWLVDPELKQAPEVFLDGVPLEKNSVSAFVDHLEISLPDGVRNRLSIDNQACNPRKTFQLGFQFLSQENGFWPFKRTTAAPWSQQVNVLPGQVHYRASVYLSGQDTTEKTRDVPFRAVSSNHNWSCEENKSAVASFQLPSGASVLSAEAQWTELGGRWENHSCDHATVGTQVTGTCNIRGGNKDCVPFTGPCNCSGGGHGQHYFSILSRNL